MADMPTTVPPTVPPSRAGFRLVGGMPSVVAGDIVALAGFYRVKCGFKIEFVWGEPAAYAIVSRDDVRMAIAPRTERFGPARVYVFVTDADGLHDALVAGGAAPNGKPRTQSYGMRDFTLTDPEDNEICFGQDVGDKH
ncbi:MAG: VOC family protein [Phycisphaerae bacterium]